jgi:hypothetical protein
MLEVDVRSKLLNREIGIDKMENIVIMPWNNGY